VARSGIRERAFRQPRRRHAPAREASNRSSSGGDTFHTLRNTAASLLAELVEPEAIRKEVTGHRNIATTQRYTHLRPVHEIPAHGRLADAVPIADPGGGPQARER
jgi:integrase